MPQERTRTGDLLARAVEVRPDAPPDPVRGTLRTARLILRPLTIDDRAEFLRVVRVSRAHLARFSQLHLPDESDEAMFERQISLTAAGEASGTGLRRIGTLPDGRIVGAFNLNSISRGIEWTADCTWWVAADQLRKGFGLEGVRAVVAHALRDLPDGLGLTRVRAYIQRANEASVRLALRAGFTRVGEERSFLQTGGSWDLHDVYERRCA